MDARDWGMEGWISRLERIFRAVKLSCMIPQSWIHIIIPLSKPTECTTPRVSPCVNYGLGMIMTCWYRLSDCNKCTPLVIMGKAVDGWMQGDTGRESCSFVSDSLRPQRLYSPCNSPGQNTGVGSLITSPGESSQPGHRTQVSHTAGRFFTSWATRSSPGYGKTLYFLLSFALNLKLH